MNSILTLVLIVFLSPLSNAMEKSTAIESIRGYQTVLDYLMAQEVKATSIELYDEHFYDGQLDTLEYIIFHADEEGNYCETLIEVDYPFIPEGETYESSGKASVAFADFDCD